LTPNAAGFDDDQPAKRPLLRISIKTSGQLVSKWAV